MPGIPEIAATILSQSQKRVEIAAENIANVSTNGYKSRIGFLETVRAGSEINSPLPRFTSSVDLSAGKQSETGNPTDLALAGSGFFVVGAGEALMYTRQGQFSRDGDGRLVNALGYALQTLDGGDLVLGAGAFEVAPDGTVTQGGAPVGRIAVVDCPGAEAVREEAGMFRAGGADPLEPAAATVRQGAIETSNVSTGDQMVTMMEALRRAEGAQRLVNVYDELMGRTISTLGQN